MSATVVAPAVVAPAVVAPAVVAPAVVAPVVIGPVRLDGVTIETWLLRFDKTGACLSPRTRAAFLARLADQADRPVILFCHGWNDEFGDASALYAGFLHHLQTHLQHEASAIAPIFIGLIWPSTWFSTDTGMRLPAATAAEGADVGAYIAELGTLLPGADRRQRLYALAEAARLEPAEADELAALLAAALDAETFCADGDDLARADGPTIAHGMRALPAAPDAGPADFLNPVNALRVASVYQMKDRAGAVGWRGVGPLVGDILAISRAPLHAVGHSFGAKVVLSAIAAMAPPRKVASVLLLEPALSHLCFAANLPGGGEPGGYRDVLDKIERSVLMTYSAHDFPLHDLYHLALRRAADLGELELAGADTSAGMPPNRYAALGGYGPRGAGECLREPLPEPGTPIDFPAPPIPLAYDGTMFGRINGHGDVCSAYTSWLLYAQMST